MSIVTIPSWQTKENLRPYTLEAQLVQHERVTKASAIRERAMDERKRARGDNNARRRKEGAVKATKMWEEAEEEEERAVLEILKT